MTEEEADAAVCYYDLDGTGEMSYEVRRPLNRPILYYFLVSLQILLLLLVVFVFVFVVTARLTSRL